MSIREQYQRERWVALPALLAPDEVERLEQATRGLPGRRVRWLNPARPVAELVSPFGLR